MSSWYWLAIATVAMYATFVAWLAMEGRRANAGTLVRLIPDCAVLIHRLLRDPRVPRRSKWLLLAGIAYLAMPIDLVPDFIPVAGQLDDAIIVAIVLRNVLRSAGTERLEHHWPGPQASLDVLIRLSGVPAR